MSELMEQEDHLDADDLPVMATYMRLLRYVKPYLRFFLVAFTGYIIFALSQPAFAMLMKVFVEALEGKMVDDLYLIPLACVGIALARGIGSYLGSYYMSKAGANIVHSIRRDLFSHLVSMPVPYFDNNKTGYLISLFTYNCGALIGAITGALTILVREGVTVIALLAYMFYINWKLTFIFFLLGPPMALAISWIGKKIKVFGKRIQESVGEINHVSAEIFSGIRLVKSSASEVHASERFEQASHRMTRLGLRMAKIASVYTPMMQMLIVTAMAVVMYVVLLVRGDMESSTLISYVTAAALLPKSIRSLSGVHAQILQGVVASEKVFEQLDLAVEKNTGNLPADHLRGDIEFDSVSFSYHEGEAPVVADLSFKVAAQTTVALVGKSGSGKSTIVSLLPRFYEIDQGDIRIDDKLLQDYDLPSLRRQIAFVSQHVVLFNDSVANNIAYGSEQVDRNAIERAARAANAHEFIAKLPNGYDTLIGENGTRLSGGQRQRLAIARAILRDAKILILDEATSALDNESEVLIQAELDLIMRDRTTLVIAHRLSTVENADVILVMDQGRIIESGTHAELMAQQGAYTKMVNRNFVEE